MLENAKLGAVIAAVLLLAIMAVNEAVNRRAEPIASVGDCPAVLMVPPDGDPAFLTRPDSPAC